MVSIYYSEFNASMDSHKLLADAIKDYCDTYKIENPIYPLSLVRDSDIAKPYIKDRKDLYFSISHSGKWWTCAIAKDEVGLDIQEISTRKVNVQKLAKRFYNKREIMWLEEKGCEQFYRLWAYKESFVKYTGVGLTQGLDYFCVISKDGQSLGMENVFQKEQAFPDKNYYLVLTFREKCDITMKVLNSEKINIGDESVE